MNVVQVPNVEGQLVEYVLLRLQIRYGTSAEPSLEFVTYGLL